MPDGTNGERRRNVIGSLGGVWAESTKSVRRKVFGIGGSIFVTLAGLLFWGGYYFYQFDQEYKPLPQQVSEVEALQTDSVRPTLRSLQGRIDSLELRQGDAAEERQELNRMLRQLRALAQANNCWIRVAAEAESRFNCSEAP